MYADDGRYLILFCGLFCGFIMKRTLNRLAPNTANKTNNPGLYADGGGLYLQITPKGVKSWLFRYMRHGKSHAMGLGPVHAVSLADARIKAAECRKFLAAGIDPLSTRKSEEAESKLAAARSMTF